jgi:hypothetical protein
MKRTLIAVTFAVLAVSALASTDSYRFNAGEEDKSTIQLGDAGQRINAGDKDSHQPQVG